MGGVLGFDWVQVACVLRDWYGQELSPELHWGLRIMEHEMLKTDSMEKEKIGASKR